MGGIKICGAGHAVPKQVLTNQDLERMVETNDAWIQARTGISQRYRVAEEPLGTLCLQAAKTALREAGISAEDIGVCIVATITPDSLVPSQACRLQRDLGLPQDTLCFDLNAACTGFLFALRTMEGLLSGSVRPYGLVLGAEALSRIVNWEDRSTCILFGDGAGAAVVRYSPDDSPMYTDLGCRGDDRLLTVPGPGQTPMHISMEGQSVFRFAVETVPASMDRLMEKARVRPEDVDFFVFHQANARIMDLVVRKYHIPSEKYYKNIHRYGNTSAASIPLVLSELWEQGKLYSGCRALVMGFGGGLTWGSALVEFA